MAKSPRSASVWIAYSKCVIWRVQMQRDDERFAQETSAITGRLSIGSRIKAELPCILPIAQFCNLDYLRLNELSSNPSKA